MILPLAGILIGLIIGAVRAKLRGGSIKDVAQWSLVYAILLGIIGLFMLISIDRSYLG